MMGNTIEFYADDAGDDPAGVPRLAHRRGRHHVPDTSSGFRNMGDPAEDDDPDHYSIRYRRGRQRRSSTATRGIANHAYYLAVNGGQNGGCIAQNGHPRHPHRRLRRERAKASASTAAAQIFYNGFTSLPEFGNFCDARNATVAVAGGDAADISDAWAAVGVHSGCTPRRAAAAAVRG